jgi:hypothetical protein
MAIAIVVFAVIGFVAGILAARYWSLSTKVQVPPMDLGWSMPGTGGYIEPVLPELKALDLSVANMKCHQANADAFAKSGRLGNIAACWSGVSAAAGFIAALLAAYPLVKP